MDAYTCILTNMVAAGYRCNDGLHLSVTKCRNRADLQMVGGFLTPA